MCSENLLSPRRFVSVLIYLLAVTFSAAAQSPQGTAQSEKARGVQLYQQKDYKGAILVLKKAAKSTRDDPEIWYYTGLSLTRLGKQNDARKAFEQAVKIRPNYEQAIGGLAYMALLKNDVTEAEGKAQKALALNRFSIDARYVLGKVALRKGNLQEALETTEAGLKLNPEAPSLLLLKGQILVSLFAREFPIQAADSKARSGMETEKGLSEEADEKRRERYSLLKQAADIVEKMLQLNPQAADAVTWQQQLIVLRHYSRLAEKSESTSSLLFPSQATTRPILLKYEKAAYTSAARQAGVQGAVCILGTITPTGQFEYPLVLRALSHGLTEEALKVVRKLQFRPATKEGQPVAAIQVVEFSFNIY